MMKDDPALVHEHGPFAGRLLFPYGWGVVLAAMRRSDVIGSDFDELFPPARTLLRDDLDEAVPAAAFQHRLWGMFTVSYPHTLTLPQRDRVRWHLFPEVRLQPQTALDFGAAPETAPPLPDLLQVMDLQQEQVARTLGEGHRVIHGAAGSGKTMILIFRAQYLAAAARADQPVLVLCFNRTLADRIRHQLRERGVDERVQVRTFHGWCQDLVRSYQLGVPPGLKGDAHFAALARAVERAVDSGRVPGGQYLALLIDEAHDFEDAWLRIAGRMVSPATNSLLVLYDDAQSIYQGKRRRFNFASVGIEARGRTSILRLNYRNTTEVLALALQCAQGLLQGDGPVRGEDELPLVQPLSAGRRGALPVLVQARHAQEEADLLAERLLAHAAAQAVAAEVGPVTVWAAPDPAHPAFGRLARRHGLELRPQGEGDLGARMAHVFESTWRADPGPLLLMGTDAPAMRTSKRPHAVPVATAARTAAAAPAGNNVSACRNSKTSPPASSAPVFICRARPRSLLSTRSAQGAASAGVPSRLPPSTTITSCPHSRSGASARSAATTPDASSSTGTTIESHPAAGVVRVCVPVMPQHTCTTRAACRPGFDRLRARIGLNAYPSHPCPCRPEPCP